MNALKVLKDSYKTYFERCLKIRNKEAQIVPFITNAAQDRLIKIIEDWKTAEPDESKRRSLYIIILKARQLGFSTATEAVFFHDLNFSFNKVAMIVSFDEDSAVTINDMSDRFYKYLPQVIKPKRRPSRGKGILMENPRFDDSKEISKDNDPGLQNKFLVETAKNLNAGSSYTINYLHISELAKWDKPEETMTSIMQSVPDYGAITIVESTAKGMNFFSELWDNAERGNNNFVPLFVAWFENPRYRAPYTGFELTPYERDIQDTYKLDLDQLQWRRNTMKDKLNGDESLFKQEYPCNAMEAFLTTGTPVFNNEIVIKRIRELELNPIGERGNLKYMGDKERKITFVPDERGWLTVFKHPEPGKHYISGNDVAQGVEGGDFDAAPILDNATLEQVATFHGHLDVDLYAEELYKLGMYYNKALLGTEVNFNPGTVLQLEKMNYPRLYMRQNMNTISKDVQNSFGWHTSMTNRNAIISELVEYVREHTHLIKDVWFLKECLKFVKNKQGRPEAMPGEHDDRVLAYAITLAIRGQQSTSTPKEQPSIKDLPLDLQEDYAKASPDMKKYLADKWGLKVG
ncbi:hypothetical protein MHI32_01590 [Paenibacillus sp. FSL H7-0690]|uniref:hypothetical protein n=1 Tax=Paenibacillus sp. FSL H7-0690 TaxID=2921437 RepID=UPI0030EB4D99